jgi:hypothetical protein
LVMVTLDDQHDNKEYEMDEPKTWEEILAEVKAGEGVTTLYAQSLRIAHGAGRLTYRINSEISDALRSRGLGHVPAEIDRMPTDQGGLVRVYDATSELGKMIAAAQLPGEDADRQLRESVNGEAAGILNKIRSLVEVVTDPA